MEKRSAEEIQNWLVSYLATELKIAPTQISLDDEFVDLGLSSRQAINLTGKLEDFLNCTVDVSLAWEYPTVRQLAEQLSKES
ncbi:acyl carrier protein [Sorangium sp. So ce269]